MSQLEDNERRLAVAQEAVDKSRRADKRTKSLLLLSSCLLAFLVVVCGILAWQNGNYAAQAADAAQAQAAEKKSLAEQVAAACAKDDFKSSPQGKQVCQRADQVAKDTTPVTGSKGDQGIPGLDGADGKDGTPGRDGRDGRNGASGTDGAPGLPGAQGAAGQNGAQGVPGVPGEKGDKGDKGDPGEQGQKGDQGIPGRDGADGKDGSPPSSWNFTQDGVTYACTPQPPGSTTYTCTASTPTPSPSP
ncbi:hypothetical protein C6401_15140 [Arthrobacter woluwensis]|uniref:collagen-like protein n=1 Tax=Arthrobacter woluwensis TaxID=156980 RepID=UPI000D1203AE|nr:collagen-like protein [Arthrobacter woluwensis]PSS42892.1 hypothetical protein C6401_15140 [Arthrobacter woluwensis]